MRYKIFAVAGLALILSIGIFAQQQDQVPNQPNPEMMGQRQGMMGGGMMLSISQILTHHEQMNELMNKLTQNMTAIQNEKDPATLKAKLAEHQALLQQMRNRMTQQGAMMQNMSGQIQQSCPMTDKTPPRNDKTPAE